jgi:hypothetical protein
MPNPQQQLAMDECLAFKKQVVIFRHRSGQRILDGDGSRLHGPGLQGVEDVGATRAGNDESLRLELSCGFMTERAQLSLDGDLHLATRIAKRYSNRGLRVASRVTFFTLVDFYLLTNQQARHLLPS